MGINRKFESMIGTKLGIYSQKGAEIPLLLDLFPNAESAYALDKLRNAYTGSCIRVRRSSDNAELDIGFVGNNFDTASLLTFVGAGNGFVSKRYDQSANSFDLLQASAANQPQIVSSGSIVTESGYSMIDYDGANSSMETASGLNFGTSSRSVFIVQKSDATGNGSRLALNSSYTPSNAWIITPEIAIRTGSTTWVTSTPTSTTNISLISNIYLGGNLFAGNSMWLDGDVVSRTSGTDGTPNTLNTPMFEGLHGALYFNGKADLTVVYKSDQTANLTAINNFIKTKYGIS